MLGALLEQAEGNKGGNVMPAPRVRSKIDQNVAFADAFDHTP